MFTSQQWGAVCALEPGYGARNCCEATRIQRESDEVLSHVHFAFMRHREHKVKCEFTYVGGIFYVRATLTHFATNSGAHLDLPSQTLFRVRMRMAERIKVNIL